MIGDLLAKLARKQDLTPGEIEELRLGANSMKALTDLVSGWQTVGMNNPSFDSIIVRYLEFEETPRYTALMTADPIQTLKTAESTKVTFASAVETPSGYWFDDTVSDTDITVPVDGTYIFGGWASFANSSTSGARHVFVKCNTTNYALATLVPGALFYDYLPFFDIANLKKDTVINLWVIQNSGRDLYLGETRFVIARIGEYIT